MAKVRAEASIFEVPSEGVHPAVVVAVIDLGTHLKEKDEKKDGKTTGNKVMAPQFDVYFGFELDERKSDGSPFVVAREVNMSLAPLAILPKLYKACGLEVPQPGEESIVQEVFAGRRLSINLSHTTKKDKQGQEKTYVKIEGFAKAGKNDEPFEPLSEAIYWELGQDIPDGLFEGLPRIFGRKVEDVIADSVEMQKLAGATA